MKSAIKKAIIVVCFLFTYSASGIYAQEMHFTNISGSLNLPSQECYSIIQDSKGYIWICTENGLVKYSKGGKKVFDKQNGLDENSAYYIGETKPGEISLLTSDSRYLKITNDRVYEHKGSDLIRSAIKSGFGEGHFNVGYAISEKGNGDLIINSQYSTQLYHTKSSTVQKLTDANAFNSDAQLVVVKNNKKAYFVKNNHVSLSYPKDKHHFVAIDIIHGSTKKRILVQLNKNEVADWRIRIEDVDGITFLAVHNKLIRIDKHLNVNYYSFPKVITSVYVSPKRELWIGCYNHGVYHYSDIYNMNSRRFGLNGLTVSSILEDNEGGIWCTTTEKGVFYANNSHFQYFPNSPELNNKTSLLKVIDTNLFFSTEIDKLCILTSAGIKSTSLPRTGNAEITDLIRYKGDIFFTTKGYAGRLGKDWSYSNLVSCYFKTGVERKSNISAYQLDTCGGSLYLLGTASIYKFDGNYFHSLIYPLQSKGRCMKVYNDGIIYVGCNDGIYKLSVDSKKLRKINPINSAVTKIIRASDGYIYFTTRGQGLYKLVNDVPVKIEIGEANYNLNDLLEDQYGRLWVSSSDGIIRVSKWKGNYTYEKYTVSNGLISNNTGQITLLNNHLYISTSEGVCMFSIHKNIKNTTPPRVYINELRINDNPWTFKGRELDLQYNENSISIVFDQMTYKTGGFESIEYKVIGLHSTFRKLESNKLILEDLRPNTYVIIAYSVNSDGVKSKIPVVLKLTIHPPFWLTAWFITLVVIVFLMLVVLIVSRIIRQNKLQHEEKTRINQLISESQLTALQAQMNPHFIFNAINGIQNYVLNRREDEAYNYLAKFSKLVRMVLNNSRDKELSLHTEIETLNLYIELEQLRFDNSFEYKLNVAHGVNSMNIEIPAMLIQPYVENAIWHGLMNLNGERKGVLTIDIKIENDMLVISIEDNGVGRVRSNEFKGASIHHSVGMQLTEERLEIINKLWDSQKVKVHVHDLYDQEHIACGTRVELVLPFL